MSPHSRVRAESGTACPAAAGARPAGARAGGGEEPLLGPVTAAAEAAGVKPGMRLGEALATCPSLVLVDRDPATVEREWEDVLRRLEDTGFAVDPVEQGTVVFETKGVERLYGGVQPALERALAAVGPTWDPRIGAADRRFTALAAASVARPGQILLVAAKEEEAFLEPLPLSLLPMTPNHYAELEGLGCARSASCAGFPAVRLQSGSERRGETRGDSPRAAAGRACADASPPRSSSRRSPFPRRSRTSSRCDGRSALSSSACSRVQNGPGGRFENSRWSPGSSMADRGGGWRRLRDATAEMGRLRAALGPKLQELTAPIVELRLEAVELAEHTGQQLALVEPAGRRTSCACVKGCGRCARAPGRDRSARWWRWRRGRGFRKRERSSFRGTTSGRLNAPRPALVETAPGGTPHVVNREQVALVREEWRVVDRWWTDEPVDRHYFEVVLEGGRNVCVYRDAEA